MRFSLKEFIEHAQSQTSNPKAVGVLVKEFLHYDILQALSNSPMAEELVFQGGTALRVCHNGQRLSEDLDFVCGPAHAEFNTERFFDLLRENVAERYGVNLQNIKSPERDLSDNRVIGVKYWEFHLNFSELGRMEKIRLEVCNVPSYQARYEMISPRHALLSNTMPPFMLRCESMEEILADKLKALGSRRFVKNRDIWDLKFLAQRGVEPDYLLVAQKVQDYQNSDAEYLDRLRETIAQLKAPEARQSFADEMSRFVEIELARMFEKIPAAADSWISHAVQELSKLEKAYPEAALRRDAGEFQQLIDVGTYEPAFSM